MLPAKPRYPIGAIALKIVVLLFPIACLLVLSEPKVHAVPSYSRQTGLACDVCHYAPPELTPFGRKFKWEGYTFATKPEISEDGKGHHSGLHILEALPLSGLFFISFTSLKSPEPGTENGNFQFPQQASLFLAGKWAEHLGSFAQVTFSGVANHFSWDNTDIRYANHERHLLRKPFTYGITLNNNPTVQDLWNSTPAWGFPFTSTNVAPTPAAAAVVNGRLAQDVAGVGAYTMWNDHLYVEGTIYRSEHLGGPLPSPGKGFTFNIRGVAPYWRVAWQTSNANNDFEVGTYGIHMQSSPGTFAGATIFGAGPKDSYTDWAVDFQYYRTISESGDVLSFRGNYIRENSALVATFAAGGAAQPAHHLNSAQANVSYHFGTRLIGTGAFFNITGTRDPLLFAPAPIFGSASGSPSSTGYIADVSWWPQQNFKLSATYTGYTRFNGLGTNYDGAGRKASANNSIYLLAFFTF